MRKLFIVVLLSLSVFASDNIHIKKSNYSVDTTLEHIKNIVTKKGFKVFNIVIHSKNSKLIIFGNPKIGNQLMKENIVAGLDLPMKVLIFKDANGVQVAYKNGSFLQKTYSLKNQKLINKIDKALDKITNKATK